MQVIQKNHMEVLWHDYAEAIDDIPITNAGIIEKSSVIDRQVLCWELHSHLNQIEKIYRLYSPAALAC